MVILRPTTRHETASAMTLPSSDPSLSDVEHIRLREVLKMVLIVIGENDACAYLNSPNESLGGRPIEIAIKSEQGKGLVEMNLFELAMSRL